MIITSLFKLLDELYQKLNTYRYYWVTDRIAYIFNSRVVVITYQNLYHDPHLFDKNINVNWKNNTSR